MSASDERHLIASARSGDRDAYANLIRSYHVKVLSLCRSYLGDLASAEDAAQETFIKAYVSLKKYRGDASFGTWLYRIAVNHCKDMLRSAYRRRSESLDALVDDQKHEPIDRSIDLQTAETRDFANRLLNGLTNDHRVILSLREISGLSYTEIARTLEISLDAVKSRLKRARQEALELARHYLKSPTV